MHVRIDQARQQGGIAEIDELRAGRMRTEEPAAGDALALDENLARGHELPVSTSSRRAACKTMGRRAAGSALAPLGCIAVASTINTVIQPIFFDMGGSIGQLRA